MQETTQLLAGHLVPTMKVIIPNSEYVLTVSSIVSLESDPPMLSVSFVEIDVPVQIPENELVKVLVESDAIDKELIKSLMQRSLQNQESAVENPLLAAYWSGRAEALEFVLCLLDPEYFPDGRDLLMRNFTGGSVL